MMRALYFRTKLFLVLYGFVASGNFNHSGLFDEHTYWPAWKPSAPRSKRLPLLPLYPKSTFDIYKYRPAWKPSMSSRSTSPIQLPVNPKGTFDVYNYQPAWKSSMPSRPTRQSKLPVYPKDEIYHGVKNEATTQCKEGNSDVCITPGCLKAAVTFLDNMDKNIYPCEDFYQFACGGFIKNKMIEEDSQKYSTFNAMNDKLNNHIRTILVKDGKGGETLTTKLVQNLYKSCMNTEFIERRGLFPLKKILTKMGGWPVVEGDVWDESMFTWYKTIYISIELGMPTGYLIAPHIQTDFKDNTRRRLYLDGASLGMPSRKYLLKGFNDKTVQAYFQYQVDMAELLGANKNRAEAEMRDVIEYEIALANISLSKVDYRQPAKIYNIMTIKYLQEIVPGIPWLEYINNHMKSIVTFGVDENVIVVSPFYMQGLQKLLKDTPKRTVANYLMWRTVKYSVKYLNTAAREIEDKYIKVISGKAKRKPRWEECVKSVTSSLPFAIGSAYVSNYFKEHAKHTADDIFVYIRAQFQRILQNVDWMDDETRKKALVKLNTINPKIGYMPDLLNQNKLDDFHKEVQLGDKNYFMNVRKLSKFTEKCTIRDLPKKVDKMDWRTLKPAVINAFYSPNENSILFPAAFMESLYFEDDHPMYLKFGFYGFIVGHEITHGFDDQGSKFDANGDMSNWWNKESRHKFEEKYKCLKYQYGNITVPEININLDGKLTLGENIADNLGTEVVYSAYIQWLKNHGTDPRLPSLPYTPQQLYWLSISNLWCSKERTKSTKLKVLTGPHSPEKYRVNIPFSNSKHFAKDWNCPISTMNPIKKCSIS